MNALAIRLGVVAAVTLVLTTPAGANAPAGRYTITNGSSSNGTVYDTKTKLTWQQTAPTTLMSLADAKTYCASASVNAALGGAGWRVPTIKELLTIVDLSQTTAPFIDSSAFPGTAASSFWSATPVVGVNDVNGVLFQTGSSTAISVSSNVANTTNVRCVR